MHYTHFDRPSHPKPPPISIREPSRVGQVIQIFFWTFVVLGICVLATACGGSDSTEEEIPIKDGDLIALEGDGPVEGTWVVKVIGPEENSHKFKRLLLDLGVFTCYEHLGEVPIWRVPERILNQFEYSMLLRNAVDDNLYAIYSLQGKGVKVPVNLDKARIVQSEIAFGRFFVVNECELNLYDWHPDADPIDTIEELKAFISDTAEQTFE